MPDTTPKHSKDKRRVRNERGWFVPENPDEPRKVRAINLTDHAWQTLERLGMEAGGLSRSEVVERLTRQDIEVAIGEKGGVVFLVDE